MEVPETNIIPSSDDFEEVSIDGTSCEVDSSKDTVAAAPTVKRPPFFMCKACDVYFPELMMLKRHMKAVHKEPVRERKSLLEQLRERAEGYYRNSSGRYVCNYCDFRSFAKTKISAHVANEHGRNRRSVALRTPSVTVAIETRPVSEVEQAVVDFDAIVEKVEPKPEPEVDLDVDMDQFEQVEEDIEDHKVEPESEPEAKLDEMDQFEQVDDTMEPETKEEVDLDADFIGEPAADLEAETEAEIELVLEPELLEEQEAQNVQEIEIEKSLPEHTLENHIELTLEPESSEDIQIVEEVDPIQPDVDPDLPAGLEHGEEEMMIVPEPVDTEIILSEAQIINEEDLHYVQEVEVTAEEAPVEGFEEYREKGDSSNQQPTGGRWPNSMANLLPEELFRCPYCDYQASRRPTLYAHVRRKHRTQWLEATGRNEAEHPMSQEQLSALGLAARQFPCEHCDYASTTRGTLVSHMRNKHPEKEVPPAVRKPLLDLRCDMCDFRTRSRRKIEVHIERKHVTELRYTCEYCGKKFKVKCDLTSHIRFQHFKTPTICDVCGKICSNTNSLHVHQKREHFKPKFECHICTRRVVSQANLDEHIRRQHEERTKYMCDQCGKVFDQQNKLRQHIMTHTGERPHTCHICGKSFARRAVFRQHFLIHTGERPYVCDICGKSFTQKPGLICHRKMHPGDKPPLPVVYIDHILKKYERGEEED